MTEQEFDYLMAARKKQDLSAFKQETAQSCQKAGWIKDGKVTDAGMKALEPYKVDNAIIMAAGRSRRERVLGTFLV